MKLELQAYTNNFNFKVSCCKKTEVKITKQKWGGCFSYHNFKCPKCGKRAKLKHWFTESYIPTKEEKKEGLVEREYKHTDYIFEVL